MFHVLDASFRLRIGGLYVGVTPITRWSITWHVGDKPRFSTWMTRPKRRIFGNFLKSIFWSNICSEKFMVELLIRKWPRNTYVCRVYAFEAHTRYNDESGCLPPWTIDQFSGAFCVVYPTIWQNTLGGGFYTLLHSSWMNDFYNP